jgi:hypothetical protein
VAPLPGGQPAVRLPGDDARQGDPGDRRPAGRLRKLLLAAVLGLVAVDLARRSGVVGRGAVPALAWAGLSGAALFGLCGFGLVRLLLPDGLRRYEPLWILPVGACALALALTVLGYLYVPFDVSLALVLVAAAALAAFAWRRTGGGPALRTLRASGWVGYVAVLLAAIALIPLFRAGFATVEGEGQDAHMAVGTAMFLQHHHPSAVAIEEPVDEVWLVWRSKPPIYYALAAHARVSGLEVFEVISTQLALLLAVTVCGLFLVARELLRAPPWVAVAAAGLAGLDRMVLHTVMHPYFNQTWGLMTVPFALVLSWWAVVHRTRRGLVLLALLLVIGAFAYPLMLPIPGVALAVWLWPERRRLSPRRLGLTRRSLLWLVPLTVVLALPIAGVLEKANAGAQVVLNPTRSLRTWGGDLTGYFDEAWFFGLPDTVTLAVLAPALVYGIWRALRGLPPLLARGLVAILLFGVVFAVWFRLREFGFYFHFKLLAFVGPLAVLLAAVGLARLRARGRAVGVAAVVVLVGLGLAAAEDELGRTFDQLPKRVLELRTVADTVPPGESVRIDVDPLEQNWIAFWLYERPVCSPTPLIGTAYPRVRRSRRADWILAKRAAPRPADAAGPPRRLLQDFALYRARPDLPGRENCSREMVRGVTVVDLG